MIYIHPKFSNELGFWRWQPRLVAYATEIGLVRSLVASQQMYAVMIHVMAFSGGLGWFSLRCRRNLTPVSSVCEAAPNALFCVSEFEYALRLACRLVIANHGEGKSETHFR